MVQSLIMSCVIGLYGSREKEGTINYVFFRHQRVFEYPLVNVLHTQIVRRVVN